MALNWISKRNSLLAVLSITLFTYITLYGFCSITFEIDKWSMNYEVILSYKECRQLLVKELNAGSLSWLCDEEDEWPVKNLRSNSDRSEIGKLLYSEYFTTIKRNFEKANTSYLILMWKDGPYLSKRFLHSFTHNETNPFQDCSVSNCRISYSDSDISKADAVVFHMHRIKDPKSLPKNRRSEQRWIFFTDESPHHTFLFYSGPKNKIINFNGIFNWSMTFRHDADVPVPYGRTIRREKSIAAMDIYSKKSKFIAAMGSNCGGVSKRWNFLRELSQYVKVDLFGGCGKGKKKTACPGGFTRDCPAINPYKFFLAFENSACTEYITEKFWWNSLKKQSVPVVLGGFSRKDYEIIAPPKSFIHVNDFKGKNPHRDLAQFLRILDQSPHLYNKFHRWRMHYKVLNEHGYFGSPDRHYCRICEALNLNDRSKKVYDNLYDYWNVDKDCVKVNN